VHAILALDFTTILELSVARDPYVYSVFPCIRFFYGVVPGVLGE
jgi:hypothetical protein